MSNFTLPDFDDMMQKAEDIKSNKYKKMILDIEIKEAVSDIIHEVTTNEQYFVKDKPPAMNFIDNTYGYAGIDGELIEKRKELAQIESELSHLELLMRIYHDMIEVWRTMSANERASA